MEMVPKYEYVEDAHMTRIKNAITLIVSENLRILKILLKKMARLASKLIRVH